MGNEQRTSVTGESALIASIQSDLAGLRELMQETDKRYAERFQAQEKFHAAALAASEKQVALAEANAEKWRANANEWRGAMDDREGKFVLKDSLGPELSALHKEVDVLRENAQLTAGKGAGMTTMWGYVTAAVTLLISVLGAFGIVLHFSK
jgi:hypothetical protein